MIQQPKPSYNFTITHSYTTYNTSRRLSTFSTCSTDSTISTSPRLLPSVLIDFTAMTLCDLIPRKPVIGLLRPLPEYVFFVQKITHAANINARTLLVALLYLQRAKTNLPRHAAGSDDTNHRMFIAAILTASKFLQDTTWLDTALTNRCVYEICGGLFSLQEINTCERAFLRLLKYNCWVDDEQLNQFVELHRSDFSL